MKQQPVRCGCGGEAQAKHCGWWASYGEFSIVECCKCETQTCDHYAKTIRGSLNKAIRAWNRAMSGGKKDVAAN